MSVRDGLRRLLPGGRARATATPANPTAPLPPPTAPRMNRNALTIAAAAAGMLAIAVVVLIQPAPQPGANAAPTPPVAPGTYLDQPPRNERAAAAAAGTPPTGPSAAASGAGQGMAPGFGTPSGARPAGATPGAVSPADAYTAAADAGTNTVTVPIGAVYATTGAPQPPRPPTLAELRRAAYRKALTASAAYDEAAGARETGTAPNSPATPTGGTLAPGFAPPTRATGQADAPAFGTDVAGQGGAGEPGTPTALPAGRFSSFLADAAQPRRTVQALTVDPAPSAFAVQAGTVIPAVLMTEINSDLPGECLAQTTRDVFDTRTQHVLLIPRGAKLLCRYDDQLGAGQSRLLVAWTRILLADGRSIQLPGLPATDQAGARGVADQVDRHMRRTFATAGALSLLSAGVQLSQPQNGNLLATPSAGQVAAGALGQQLNSVAIEMLRRDLNNQQTIRIRQGTQFNVFLNTDLVFPGPYGGAGGAFGPRGAAVARGAGAP